MPRDPAHPAAKHAFSTLHFPRRREWNDRVDTIDPKATATIPLMRALVDAGRRYETLIVNGSGSPFRELAAASAAVHRRRVPHVIVADCVWGVGTSRANRLLSRTGIRMLDTKRVHYCVHSRAQRERFPPLWRVDPGRVHVTPYYYTLSEEELALPVERSGGVFAGGDSHRDYGPLLAAARRLDVPFTLATRRLAGAVAALPSNVRAGRVAHDEFMSLMREASVVVVPLRSREDRSAGEQTYLNAMALGKPVIVVDSLGVREYVDDGKSGLVVPPGDADALTEAIAWTLDDANRPAIERITTRARDVARGFGPDAYVAGLLRVLDEVLA
jgi:glycosyltransferase involved in cell wall biosynthesis